VCVSVFKGFVLIYYLIRIITFQKFVYLGIYVTENEPEIVLLHLNKHTVQSVWILIPEFICKTVINKGYRKVSVNVFAKLPKH